MAEIKMDLSEYERMQENKKLLENALNREQELQKQVEKLNKEKIKALEDAKMKVTKVTKTEVIEHLLHHKTNTDQIIKEVLYAIGIDPRNIMLDRYNPISILQLRDIFFEKARITSTPVEEVTTHGLDDIIIEIREKLEKDFDNEIKSKLKNAEDVQNKYYEIINQNKHLTKVNEGYIKSNKNLVNQCDKLVKQINDLQKDNEKINKIKEILKNNYYFWNVSRTIKSIISIINKD